MNYSKITKYFYYSPLHKLVFSLVCGYLLFVFLFKNLNFFLMQGCITSIFLTVLYLILSFDFKISKFYVGFYLICSIGFVFLTFVIFKTQNTKCELYKSLAVVSKIYPVEHNWKSPSSRRIDYNVFFNNTNRTLIDRTYNMHTPSLMGDTVMVTFRANSDNNISIESEVRYRITNTDRLLYTRPVLYRNGREIGNKYFYYAKLFPDRVFKNFGYEILYKSVPINVSQSDSIVILQIKDIQGNDKQLKYKLSDLSNIPDTFLVFKNINDSISAHYTVCAPEINTPKNWAKISDYGYLFGYDEVYSKQEIESQCPRIKDYVEQYKKRITPPTN